MVLSYHSLEDRPVKQRFQRLAREGSFRVLTRKVIRARRRRNSADNPRARSAKMRVAEKIDADGRARGRELAMNGTFHGVPHRKANR